VAGRGALGQQFATPPAATWDRDALLPRVWAEQGEVTRAARGTPPIPSTVAAERPWDRLLPPAAPDSSDKAHRGQGSAGPILETYAEEEAAAGGPAPPLSPPDLLTPIAGHTMPHQDSHALAPALAAGRARQGWPARLLGDRQYGSPGSVEPCHSEGMVLVAPARPPQGAHQGPRTLEPFI
jgi:hypothetical protein